MRTGQATLGIALGGLLGMAVGLVAASMGGMAGGSPLAVVARWAEGTGSGRVEALEGELRSLSERTQALDQLAVEVRQLQQRVEGLDGARDFAEAKRLGIVDAVTEARPSLKPTAVRRMAVAIVAEAKRYQLDPLLLAAVARVESGYNPFAVSEAGAMGLLQLTPPTGRALSLEQGNQLAAQAELYDIETNVALGARYLADLVRRFERVDTALLAYNRGPGSARAVLKTPNAQRALDGYPRLVLSERQRLAERAKRKASSAVSL